MVESKTDLARAIQSARKQLHLSQKELAEKVDCSQSTICQIEGGNFDVVSSDTLKVICKKLNIDLAVLAAPPSERLLFCSQATCPQNTPYLVNGKLCFQPSVILIQDAADTLFCPGCGGALSEACNAPECRAPVQVGAAFCMACGEPFVEVPRAMAKHDDPKEFVLELIEQRKLLAENLVAVKVPLRHRGANHRKTR